MLCWIMGRVIISQCQRNGTLSVLVEGIGTVSSVLAGGMMVHYQGGGEGSPCKAEK